MISIKAEFTREYIYPGKEIYNLRVTVIDGFNWQEASYETVYPLDFYQSHFDRIWEEVGEKLKGILAPASKALDIAGE